MTAHSNPVLGSIIEISEKLKGSAFSDEAVGELKDPLSTLSDFLKSDVTEALFFALIFALQNQDSKCVTLHDIADYLDYPFLHLLEYHYVIDSLEKKGFIYRADRSSGRNSEGSGYMVTGSVSNCVIEGRKIDVVVVLELDLEGALSQLMEILCDYKDRNMDQLEYERQIVSFEHKVQYIDLFKNISSLFPNDFSSRIILYFFCNSLVSGEDFFDSEGFSTRRQSGVFRCLSPSNGIKRKRSLLRGQDVLEKDNYLEKFSDGDSSDRGSFINFRLTSHGVQELFGSDAENYSLSSGEKTELEKTISIIMEMQSAYEENNALFYKVGNIAEAENKGRELDYFKKLKSIVPNDEYRWLYIDCVADFILGGESCLMSTLRDLYGRGSRFHSEIRSFLDEKHVLLENGLLELIPSENVEKTNITLSEKSVELLYGENADIYKRKRRSVNVIEPGDLKEKKLFYSHEVQSQIDMLCESLVQEKLEAIQKRLKEKNLPEGVAVLLYGAPGTGKTETVYQLAKKTNRKIYHVDIADSKSMWFGESEKRIKKIFTDYRSLCRACKSRGEHTPVLLFNEADALISKRSQFGDNSRSVDQTENAIQNVLLEEMEKLEGILIATTNLCENMDSAFERRFLFKIKYEKPSVEARSRIWSSKLEGVSEDDACSLARQFDFSGGEIDNIVRKCEMDEIITGVKPKYDRILELCKKERLERKGTRSLGFAV